MCPAQVFRTLLALCESHSCIDARYNITVAAAKFVLKIKYLFKNVGSKSIVIVNNATLSRFFTIHLILLFIVPVVIVIHLQFIHETASNVR